MAKKGCITNEIYSVKGHIIDEYCLTKGIIIEHNNKVYSCTLNQTDIDANKNKFYIMQLIKTSDNKYVFYTRWGRISEKGRPTLEYFSAETDGILSFEKQFKVKTGNVWGREFIKMPGKYFMSDVSYEEELKDIPQKSLKIAKSKLHEKIQNLIKMLSDVNLMQKALVSLNIDTKKLPLGKIKQSQLDMAGKVLDNIQSIIQEMKGNKGNAEFKNQLVTLSSEYYTYLPMSFGRNKPTVICTNELISSYRDVLDELRNIVVTVQMSSNVKAGENPIDGIYQDIKTTINPLRKNTKMWKEMEKYIANTHGPTHGCKLEILEIFEINQEGKDEKYKKATENIGNKTLLYHGTPQNCVLSIFKNDFYLDPSKIKDTHIQIAGKMFGYGIYFADSSKSFGYTRAHQTNDIGCYVVAEVALGNQLSKFDADYSINKTKLGKTGHHSTKGEGKWQPSGITKLNDVMIPNGKLEEVHKSAELRYNEHIVYDIDQILIKYLIVLKNTGNYDGY